MSKTCQVGGVRPKHNWHDNCLKVAVRSGLRANLLMFLNVGISTVEFRINSFRRGIGGWLPVFFEGSKVELVSGGLLICNLENLQGFTIK